VSRNARIQIVPRLRRLIAGSLVGLVILQLQAAEPPPSLNVHAQIVSVENAGAITDFQANEAVVQAMVDCGLTNLTGKATVAEAWRTIVAPSEIIGIKVFSAPGMLTGTRPAVVSAVIHGLLAAGVPSTNIIIWDKLEADLRAAGYFRLAKQLGVHAAGGLEAGWDPTNFYQPDTAIIGNLLWSDLEFGKTNLNAGRRSFFSKLVSRQMTKIISIAPLLNQEDAGVCGHFYGLALGSVDNTRRFESDSFRLANAVPEIYALPLLGDRVVLNITDALIGQYEGGARSLLHYSCVLNQLWFGHDPVALDMWSIKELDRERRTFDAPQFRPNLDLYSNAHLLQLGENDLTKIHVEKIR
jgi:hypothetical protein